MITMLYTGICVIAMVVMIAKVIIARRTHKVGLGDGGNQVVAQAMRVHGNFIEQVPIILFMMYILEQQGMSVLCLHVAGGILVISRVLHAQGLYGSPYVTFGRFVGTFMSIILMLVGALLCIGYSQFPDLLRATGLFS